MVKNPPANAKDIEMQVRKKKKRERDTGLIPGQEDPLEEGMATQFSILA